MLAHANAAVKLGAQLRTGETVLSWQTDGSGVIVATDQERYAAQHIILTTGAWAADFLGALHLPLEVRRKALFWYDVNNRDYAVDSGCPTFFYELPEGDFYGFPQIDQFGLKIAEHSGGQPVSDPLNLDLAIDSGDQSRIERFLHDYMPSVTSTCLKHVACMYTMSPDEHFIVDRPDSWYTCRPRGSSGHLAVDVDQSGIRQQGEFRDDPVVLAMTKFVPFFQALLRRGAFHRRG